MSQDLIMGFLEKLNKPDLPHGLMLNGVYSASKWFKSLKEDEKKNLYDYMKKELNQNGDLLTLNKYEYDAFGNTTACQYI